MTTKLTTMKTSFDKSTNITKCVWTVQQDYVQIFKDTPNGSEIKSSCFNTDQNLRWFITCCPNGYDKEEEGNCIVYLGLASLPKEYTNITMYFYIRCVESNSCTEMTATFVRSGDEWGRQLTSELMKYSNISFEIGMRVLCIRQRRGGVKYRYPLPISTIKKNIQLKWNINQQLLNCFKTANWGKEIDARLLSDINPMFSIECYPNGDGKENKGYLSLYLYVCTFPSNVGSMKIKYTIQCPKINEMETMEPTIFDDDNKSCGWTTYCALNKLLSVSCLDIICDIEIMELYDENGNIIAFEELKNNTQSQSDERENKMIKYEEMIDKLQKQIITANEKHKTLLETKSNNIQSFQNQLNKLNKANELKETHINALQNKINDFKKEITTKENETTQANLRQTKTILELQNLLKAEEEEKNDNKQKYLAQILIGLNNEIEIFKKLYNKQKLQEIFDKSAQELIQNNSEINKNINEYNNNNNNVILKCKSFSKYINDIQSFITKIITPNVNEYKTWNLEQIMTWIVSLDNGKYDKYTQKLRDGFLKSEILCGDLLPELTRHDLSNPPFSINKFVIKRDLEKHFKSLINKNMNNKHVENNKRSLEESLYETCDQQIEDKNPKRRKLNNGINQEPNEIDDINIIKDNVNDGIIRILNDNINIKYCPKCKVKVTRTDEDIKKACSVMTCKETNCSDGKDYTYWCWDCSNVLNMNILSFNPETNEPSGHCKHCRHKRHKCKPPPIYKV